MSARRDPFHAFEFAASLFAFAYEAPACELALLLDRKTTRAAHLGKSAILSVKGRANPALAYRLSSYRLGDSFGLQEGRYV